MNKTGFTLMEVLAVVIIVGVLVSVSMPMYTRAIERSRATEAMNNIKAANDAIYVYFSDKEQCPDKFSQLIVTLPPASGSLASDEIQTRYFTFKLKDENVAKVPGTQGKCPGVLATRSGPGSYSYKMYNPYASSQGKALSLRCEAVTPGDSKSQAVCDSLGLSDSD